MSIEKKMDLLYDYYQKSFELVKAAQERRNKLFALISIWEMISFILIINPTIIFKFVNDAIKKEVETTVIVSVNILHTFIWVIIVYTTIRYIQETLYIEKQYVFLDDIEKKLTILINENNIFTREGENYLNNYPVVLNLIDLFYKTICPIFYILINTLNIISEWKFGYNVSLNLIIDSFLFFLAFIITWFYYFQLHHKTTKWCKDHIPCVAKISDAIHALLKNV